MTIGVRHKRPWPWDVALAGVGVMLKPDQNGNILSSPRVKPLSDVLPPTWEYGSAPPYNEQTYPFKRLELGMGEKIQTGPVPHRTRYCLGVDTSVNGLQVLGYEFTTITPTLTGQINGFIEGLPSAGAADKLFVLAGRYMLRRDGDLAANFVQVGTDLGAGGELYQQATRFQGTGGPDSLAVATSAAHLYTFDVVAGWRLGTVTNASFVTRLGNELWVASGNTVKKAVADWIGLAANYAGAITVGDASHAITWLAAIGNSLVIFKSDGLFTINADTSDNDLFPEFRGVTDPNGGRQASNWLNSLWFPYGDGFHQAALNGEMTLEMHPSAISKLLENDSEVRGAVTASTGWDGWNLFLAQYNEANTSSYIVKYGGWTIPEDSAQPSVFVPGVHGAIAKFTNKKITSMKVSTIPGPNKRLYVGFADGDIAWALLPRGTPFAPSDPNCRFQTSGDVFWPIHHAGFQADDKAWRGASVFGPKLSITDYVDVNYRLTPDTGAFTPLGAHFTTNGTRYDFPKNTVSKLIEIKHTLVGDGATTPVVEGVALHRAVRPDNVNEHDLTVMIRDYLARRDGTVDRRRAVQLRRLLESALATKGVTTFLLPDGTTVDFQIVDYAFVTLTDQRRIGPAWDLVMKGIEFSLHTPHGTIGQLAGRSIASLSGLTIADLETL